MRLFGLRGGGHGRVVNNTSVAAEQGAVAAWAVEAAVVRYASGTIQYFLPAHLAMRRNLARCQMLCRSA